MADLSIVVNILFENIADPHVGWPVPAERMENTGIMMKEALLFTKLQMPPQVADLLPRKRLVDLLERGGHRPLTLFSAAAGYGKSTLAAEWTGGNKTASAWISLDERDNDLNRFLSYVLGAIRQVLPDIPLATEALCKAETMPPPAETARLLLNDLFCIQTPLQLVLDDYHCITDSAIHRFMAGLLERPAACLHLVVITRWDPPFPLVTLRARGWLAEIREEDLRFRQPEIALFFQKMLQICVDGETTSLLEEKIEGWAAGLRLAAFYLKRQTDVKKRVQGLNGGVRLIADYLFGEVLSGLSQEMLSFLMHISVLDRFCAPLCAAVSEHSDENTNEMLEWLVEANLFVIALDTKGVWYRFHPLLRDVLKELLQKKNPPAYAHGLHHHAGTWFSRQDLLEEAVFHFVMAEDTDAAISLLLSHRQQLMNTSRFVHLNQLMDMLPSDGGVGHPLLLTTRAFIRVEQGNYTEAKALTEKALVLQKRWDLKPETQRLFQKEVRVLTILMDVFSGTPRTDEQEVAMVFSDLPADAVFIRGYEVAVRAVFSQMAGEWDRMAETIRTGSATRDWPVNIQARMQFHLCIVHCLDANLGGIVQAARNCLDCVEGSPYAHTRAYAFYFLGITRYQQNDLSGAAACFRKVMEDRYTGNASYIVDAGLLLVLIYLAENREKEADAMLETVRRCVTEAQHPRVAGVLDAFTAEWMLQKGEYSRALKACRRVDMESHPVLWFSCVPQLILIRSLLAEGSRACVAEAGEKLIALDEKMARIHRKSIRIETSILLSLFSLLRQNREEAKGYLKTALRLAEPGGWVRSFLHGGMPLAGLLEEYRKENPNDLFARRVQNVLQTEFLRAGTLFLHEPQEGIGGLTRREKEILPLLAAGMSNKEIASHLTVSDETVKSHLKNIFRKLGAESRMDAVNRAKDAGLVESRSFS